LARQPRSTLFPFTSLFRSLDLASMLRMLTRPVLAVLVFYPHVENEMQENYVLIDYENVQPKNIELLANHPFKIYLFVGANQTKVDRKSTRLNSSHVKSSYA